MRVTNSAGNLNVKAYKVLLRDKNALYKYENKN